MPELETAAPTTDNASEIQPRDTSNDLTEEAAVAKLSKYIREEPAGDTEDAGETQPPEADRATSDDAPSPRPQVASPEVEAALTDLAALTPDDWHALEVTHPAEQVQTLRAAVRWRAELPEVIRLIPDWKEPAARAKGLQELVRFAKQQGVSDAEIQQFDMSGTARDMARWYRWMKSENGKDALPPSMREESLQRKPKRPNEQRHDEQRKEAEWERFNRTRTGHDAVPLVRRMMGYDKPQPANTERAQRSTVQHEALARLQKSGSDADAVAALLSYAVEPGNADPISGNRRARRA